MEKITVEKCPCGHAGCSDYHLVGIGKFVQGSGFTKEEAELIAGLLNGPVVSIEPNGVPVAEVVPGYSGDPDTRGNLSLKTIDLSRCSVGDKLYRGVGRE